jgi:hypothetical protein
MGEEQRPEEKGEKRENKDHEKMCSYLFCVYIKTMSACRARHKLEKLLNITTQVICCRKSLAPVAVSRNTFTTDK